VGNKGSDSVSPFDDSEALQVIEEQISATLGKVLPLSFPTHLCRLQILDWER